MKTNSILHRPSHNTSNDHSKVKLHHFAFNESRELVFLKTLYKKVHARSCLTRYWSDSTTACHQAMFGLSPSRLGAYTSLYAEAAPMSIFGSLGVVRMGFNTLVACFSFGGIEGAKIIGNMGFELLLDSLETAELSSNSLFPFFGNDSLCLLSLFDVLQPSFDKQCQLGRNKIRLQVNHTLHPQIYFSSIVKLLVPSATLPSRTDISCRFLASRPFRGRRCCTNPSSGSIRRLVFVIGESLWVCCEPWYSAKSSNRDCLGQ